MSRVFVKDLEFKLNSLDIHPNTEIKGIIQDKYKGVCGIKRSNSRILESSVI